MSNRGDWWILVGAIVVVLACALIFAGCSWRWDQSANGGEVVEMEVWNPCGRGGSGELPVGGSTGAPNTTTIGGNAER